MAPFRKKEDPQLQRFVRSLTRDENNIEFLTKYLNDRQFNFWSHEKALKLLNANVYLNVKAANREYDSAEKEAEVKKLIQDNRESLEAFIKGGNYKESVVIKEATHRIVREGLNIDNAISDLLQEGYVDSQIIHIVSESN